MIQAGGDAALTYDNLQKVTSGLNKATTVIESQTDEKLKIVNLHTKEIGKTL